MKQLLKFEGALKWDGKRNVCVGTSGNETVIKIEEVD